MKRFVKKLENISDNEAQEILEENNYVAALGICAQGISRGKPNTAVTSEDFQCQACTMLMKLLLRADWLWLCLW